MLQLKFFELHCIKISWGLNAEPNFYHERKNVKLIKFFLVEIEKMEKRSCDNKRNRQCN